MENIMNVVNWASQNPELTKTGVDLMTLVFKNAAGAVYSKVAAIKNVKENEKLHNAYNEIIDELIQERTEAIRISQIYASELSRVQISEEDIGHLHKTISSLLEVLKGVSPDAEWNKFEGVINELVSVSTLRTLQLLGFNFKEAIGEPLTELCKKSISGISTTRAAGGINKNQNTRR